MLTIFPHFLCSFSSEGTPGREDGQLELFGVRAMKHVFRIKRNISEQGWVTVLNPVLPHGYPPQFALTQLPDLTEPNWGGQYSWTGPEHRDWVARTKAEKTAEKGHGALALATPSETPVEKGHGAPALATQSQTHGDAQ